MLFRMRSESLLSKIWRRIRCKIYLVLLPLSAFPMRACLNLFGIVERAKVEDIALNQMLEYPSLSEEEKKELEWLTGETKGNSRYTV